MWLNTKPKRFNQIKSTVEFTSRKPQSLSQPTPCIRVSTTLIINTKTNFKESQRKTINSNVHQRRS